jgi:hypothetical protein
MAESTLCSIWVLGGTFCFLVIHQGATELFFFLFSDFCDIENLVNFFQISSKVCQICTSDLKKSFRGCSIGWHPKRDLALNGDKV